jgi:hypothetical protein
MKGTKMRIYISHSVRGKYGKKATDAQMKENCAKAIGFVERLRATCPSLNIHCPAEMEDFVAVAYRMGVLSEKEILKVDCEILRNCNFLLVYCPDGVISHGMQIEIDFAKKHKITTVFFYKE